MPRLGRITLLLVAYLVALASPASADPELSTSRQNLGRALEVMGRKDPSRANQLREVYRSQQPTFIFIPGILGSKIVCKGKIIWGEKNLGDGVNRDLFYKPTNCAPHFLDNFEIFGYRQDVYGRMRDIIGSMDLPGMKHFKPFPYDWRQDLRTTASRFDGFLKSEISRKDLQDREVILVAHSMGGLVATWWYNKFYLGHEKDYPFRKVGKVIFLGTPHRGAPSAVMALATGYVPAEPGGIEKVLYGKFFKDLNSACFTFPSTFQLFPLEAVIFEKSRSKSIGELFKHDSFDVATWQKCGWAEKTRKLLNQGREEFYQNFKSLLEGGKHFQSELQSFPPIPDAVYVYSDKFKTATRMVIGKSTNGECGLAPEYPEMSGDGRVPTLVAQNAGKIDNPDQLRFASLEHGALMNDEAFLRYIRNIREFSMRAADDQFLSLASQDSSVIDTMASEGALLTVPLSLQDRETESGKTLIAFNRSIVATRLEKLGSRDDPAPVVYRLARQHGRSGSDESSHLYALFLGLDSQSGLAHHAANNLGHELIRNGSADIAVGNLELAVKLKPIATEEQSKEEALAKTYNNLGLAYMATGRYTDAVKAFEASLQLDKDSKAVANLYNATSTLKERPKGMSN